MFPFVLKKARVEVKQEETKSLPVVGVYLKMILIDKRVIIYFYGRWFFSTVRIDFLLFFYDLEIS